MHTDNARTRKSAVQNRILLNILFQILYSYIVKLMNSTTLHRILYTIGFVFFDQPANICYRVAKRDKRARSNRFLPAVFHFFFFFTLKKIITTNEMLGHTDNDDCVKPDFIVRDGGV